MRQLLHTLLGVGLVLTVASCSSASSGTKSSASTTTTAPSSSGSTTTASPADPKIAAQQALDAYWSMLQRLYAAPNPADPEIAQRAVDPSLSAIRDLLTTRQATGQVEQYDGATYHIDTSVTSADATNATFSGCIVDGARLVDSKTGQVLNDKITTSRIQGTLEFAAGSWKVARFDVLRKADGEVTCAELA